MNIQFSNLKEYVKTLKTLYRKHKKKIQIISLVLIMALLAIKCLLTNTIDMWFYLFAPLSILAMVFYLDMVKRIPKAIQWIISLMTPGLCFILMEYLWRCKSDGTLNSHPFETMTTQIIIINIIIFYLLFGILFFITGRLKTSSRIMIVVALIVGLANYFVIMFRSAPIMPSDLYSVGTAAEVSNNFNYDLSIPALFFIYGFIGLFVLNSKCTCKLPSYTKKVSIWALHILPAILCIGAFLSICSYIQQNTDTNKIIEKFDTAQIVPTYMCRDDGYAAAIIYSCKFLKVSAPSGYSESKAESILAKYNSDDIWNNDSISKINNTPSIIATSTEKANIVVIMNECYSDVSVLGQFNTNKDYMPFTHSLEKGSDNTITGYLYASVLGGNTANTEFEFLTGNTMAFMPTGSVVYQQYIGKKLTSMASLLKSQNYKTIAAHPYVSKAWKRNQVYPFMGFDTLYFAMHMPKLNYIRLYADDASLYGFLKEKAFNTSDNFFSFNVTMQNHSGFGGSYDNFHPEIKATDISNGYLNNYLSLMKISDDAFKDLIDYFKDCEKPTIVVMFGDHQPSDNVVDSIYKKQGKDINALSSEEYYDRYKVPVIIWANYDIPEDNNLLISANYLSGLVTKLAGCQTNNYQNFLENLRQEIPVLTAHGYLDKDGKYHEIDELDNASSRINDYKILQYYNIYSGKQNN